MNDDLIILIILVYELGVNLLIGRISEMLHVLSFKMEYVLFILQGQGKCFCTYSHTQTSHDLLTHTDNHHILVR